VAEIQPGRLARTVAAPRRTPMLAPLNTWSVVGTCCRR